MESDLSGLEHLKMRDIREIDIDITKNPRERQKDFLQKNGSKNVYKSGGITVKCTFGNMDLKDMLGDLING